jgi:trk system potassium uptake protein TrkH
MLIRPDRHDARIIGFYVGKVLVGVGMLLLVPLVLALLRGEWNSASALAIGAGVGVVAGRGAEAVLFTREDLDWSHGMVIVATSWLLGPAVLAVPLFLSGHFGSFVDAYFDAMSGLTTSGLSLLQDLDHLSLSMNVTRHLAHFAGGQGIIIVVLTVFASAAARVRTLYVGEGRDERVVPNVVRTARFMFAIAGAWAVVGTLALTLAAWTEGFAPSRAVFHAVNLFMAGFDTGGFSPNSTSLGYYHSAVVEVVVTVLMVAGGLSFPLHFELWRRRLGRARDHLETRTWVTTMVVLSVLVLVGLARAGTYVTTDALWRKGLFTLVSAHTGTGFTVVPGRLYETDWGLFAPAIVVIAMALGAMAGSTAGGIKAVRIGLVTKSVLRDIRKAIAPPSALVVASYRDRRPRVVTDAQVRSAIVIIVLFLLTYLGGALVGVAYGHSFEAALFESTSAAANVGLSIGVLGPSNPVLLKLVYTTQMWLGRLEFLAAFALVGYGVAVVRGRL